LVVVLDTVIVLDTVDDGARHSLHICTNPAETTQQARVMAQATRKQKGVAYLVSPLMRWGLPIFISSSIDELQPALDEVPGAEAERNATQSRGPFFLVRLVRSEKDVLVPSTAPPWSRRPSIAAKGDTMDAAIVASVVACVQRTTIFPGDAPVEPVGCAEGQLAMSTNARLCRPSMLELMEPSWYV
jgi:hypothetical protein